MKRTWGIAVLAMGFMVANVQAQQTGSGANGEGGTPPATTSGTTMPATPGTGKAGEIVRDKQDMRNDRKDIKQDRRDIRRDRHDLRHDHRNTNAPGSGNGTASGSGTAGSDSGNGAGALSQNKPTKAGARPHLGALHQGRSARKAMRANRLNWNAR